MPGLPKQAKRCPVCLVGTGKGPDMYELAAFLGKEETLRRMKAAIEALH